MSVIRRRTRETEVRIVLRTTSREPGSVGAAPASVSAATGEPFLDHMLGTLGRYAGVELAVEAAGDLRHHTVEDVAISLGLAMRRVTPAACARYGSATVPMDDALVHAALDLGGRYYYQGPLPSGLYDHFMRSFAENAQLTLHVRVLRGRDRHHIVEAAFKAVGLALRQALVPEGVIFSTKGGIDVMWEEDS